MRNSVTQVKKRRALRITVFVALLSFCVNYGVAFAGPKFEMMDPYGQVKEDHRMEWRGNRGRPLWEGSTQTDGSGEKDPACFSNAQGKSVKGTYIDGTYIPVTWETYYAAYYASVGIDSPFYNY
ncbi:MAG: hypothetical protein GTO40_20670, partial [Deltaproteobacteria bacterium]|nr:hypothetical protein [Deltaproteobacteria bacterium]